MFGTTTADTMRRMSTDDLLSIVYAKDDPEMTCAMRETSMRTGAAVSSPKSQKSANGTGTAGREEIPQFAKLYALTEIRQRIISETYQYPYCCLNKERIDRIHQSLFIIQNRTL